MGSGSLFGPGDGTLVHARGYMCAPSPAPYLEESELDMTGVWFPIEAEGPLHIPRLNGKVHEAEGRLKVSIGGHECGHQSPWLCVLREAYRLNLERWGQAMSPSSVLPKISSPVPAYLGDGELGGMVIDVCDCDSNLTCAAEA